MSRQGGDHPAAAGWAPFTRNLCTSCRRIVRLVSKRWQRVVLSEPAFWRTFRLTTGRQGQPISQQQAWLLGKLRQLSLVTDWVKEFVVPDWGGLEAAAAAGGLHLSNFLQACQLAVLDTCTLPSLT